MNDNIYALIQSRFPADRSRTFIETDAGIKTDAGRDYSYADLENFSGRYARLLHDLGVGKGDRVAVQVEKSPEAIFLYLACMRIGAVYLPLNTAYTGSEVDYFLRDAEPKVVVCTPAAEAALSAIAHNAGVKCLLTLDQSVDQSGDQSGGGTLAEQSRDLDPNIETTATGADDLAALLYTSGTTGRSKGAMLSHRNLSSNALALHKIWGFSPDDVLLHALPIFHTHGLFVATNCVLLNGTKMLFLPRFDADRMVALLPRATVMMGVPTFYTRLLAHPKFNADVCRNMRLFISGSAPLLEETFHAFEARTGHRILERYGMTETGMNTSNPLDGERRAGTVGFPLPDVEARVVDDNGAILNADEVGVLEVRGPNVFKGYWRMPDKTESEFRADGFFITGDMAKIDIDGVVHIVGRSKDLIISGGFNVYPKEVELCIDAIDGVMESAVIGLAHPDFGEAVCAIVTRGSGHNDVTGGLVIERLKSQLANYKVPKRVFFVDELPRNAMGKVQKAALRDRYRDIFSSAA